MTTSCTRRAGCEHGSRHFETVSSTDTLLWEPVAVVVVANDHDGQCFRALAVDAL